MTRPGYDFTDATFFFFKMVGRRPGAALTIAINQAPVVSIGAPASGSSFVEDASIEFSGAAVDAEDGNLTRIRK